MSLDWARLAVAVDRRGAVVRVLVAEAVGSAPREAGASMTVWEGGFEGTIGGGALEFEALAEARRRLGGPDGVLRYPLGPALAQCCGGAATLVYERWDAARVAALSPEGGARLLARPLGGVVAAPDAPLAIRGMRRAARSGKGVGVCVAEGWVAEPLAARLEALWVWGAGHVGRAMVRVFEGLPFRVTWVDDAVERFPEAVRDGVRVLPSPDLAAAVGLAPAGAAHLVMTYSHALDLEVAHRLLARGDFGRLGVIGSASKAARFRGGSPRWGIRGRSSRGWSAPSA